MSLRIYLFCVLLAVLAPVDAIAQQPQIDTADAMISEPETDPVGSPFSDDTASFASELERTNYLDAGLGVTGSFSDNVLSQSSNMKSDINYLVMPSLALRQSRDRWDLRMNYQGGYSAYQHLNAYDEASHDFGVDASYKLAPHIEVGAENDLRITTGFFNQVNQGASLFNGTILEQPNQSVITPIARQENETAHVHLNDQFSEVSAIGASATFFSSRYTGAPAGTPLIDTTSEEVEGYYNRQVTRTNAVGITYRLQRLSFSLINNDTTASSVLGTYTVRPRPTLTLTVFGGPQWIDTTFAGSVSGVTTPGALPFQGTNHRWSEVGGVSFAWNGARTGITLSAIRDTSDGGGLLGAVTFTGGNLVLRRQLSRRTTLEVDSMFGLSEPLVGDVFAYRFVKSLSAEAALTRELDDHWSIAMGYAHAVQFQGVVSASGTPQIPQNRAWSSISYQFSRPLGNN